MKNKTVIVISMATIVAAGATGLYLFSRKDNNHGYKIPSVFAATGGDFPAAQFLQATDGGMAQYGYALEQSTSPSATLQALAEWNSYISVRSEWGMSSALLSRLAAADWNARQAGAPTITSEQLAVAATNLINAKLATMTAAEQQAGFERMRAEATPKGRFGLNSKYPYVSAVQNPDGTWRVTVSPEAFSKRKTWLATYAPGMVSSSANFYPAEAIMVAYSVASGDQGYGTEFITIMKQSIADLTGLSMTNRYLFGENGYLTRRPLTTFLIEQSMSQFFSELGF
ncbi:MAG: hypothetical protein ACE5HL_03265 [Terriglobia bacterium]